MIRFLLMVLVSLAGRSLASVTAAWKVPISHFAADYQTSDKVRKLEKAPGESTFFQPGDELWDVSKALRWAGAIKNNDPFVGESKEEDLPTEGKWAGEWAVWNARSGLLVARGSWNDIFSAEQGCQFDKMPRVLRTTINLFPLDESGEPGPRPEHSISLLSRSGETASGRLDGLSIETQPIIDARSQIADLKVKASWSAEERESRWEVSTLATLLSGKERCMARYGSGKSGWTLFARVAPELLDGTPLNESRWKEGPGKVELWPRPQFGDEVIETQVSEGVQVGFYPAPDDLLEGLGAAGEEGKAVEVDAPPVLADWVRGSVIDVKATLRQNGLKLDAPGSFAGFDPRSRRLVIQSTPLDCECCQQILQLTTGEGCLSRGIWVETNAQSGGWGLSSRSGEKASVSRINGKEAEDDLVFEIEPVIGGGDLLIDLRYRMDVMENGRSRGRIQSSTTLAEGQPQEVGSFVSKGMSDLKAVITTRFPSY